MESSTSAQDALVPLSLDERPGFAAAVRNSTTGSLALLDDDARFYRCISDIPTYALGVLALYLHSTDRLYHRGLQEATRDLFSAGRATAILARMQRAGLIVPRDDFQRGRQRRYAPALAMIEAFRTCYLIELRSLALIEPRIERLVEAYDDPAIFDGIIAYIARMHLAAPALDQKLVEPLSGVGRRSMGLFTAYALAEAASAAGHGRAEGVIEINISRLSNRLGVSRTHTRRVLKTLEDGGLIIQEREGAGLTLTPGFAAGYDLYFLGLFSVLLTAVDHLGG